MADESVAEAEQMLAQLNRDRVAYKARATALLAEKAVHQAAIASINETLQGLQASTAADRAAYVAERDRLNAILATALE